MEPANRAPRPDPPGDRAGFTSFAAILRLLSHQHEERSFPPFTTRPQVCPSFSLSLSLSFPLPLQFPVGRAPGFSRIEGSVLEGPDLKPLVRHERARTFSPPSSPPAPFVARSLSFYLFTRGRKSQTTELFSSTWSQPYFLNLRPITDECVWSFIPSLRARSPDCRSGLFGDLENIYCAAKAMILVKVLVRPSFFFFLFFPPFAACVG